MKKIYIQSATRVQDQYWVELHDNMNEEIKTPFPHPSYKELLNFIDSAKPSLLIAALPSKQLILLVKCIASQRRDTMGTVILNSMLLFFDHTDETIVRALSAALLTPTEEDEQLGRSSFNSYKLQLINECINEDQGETFTVDPKLRRVIEEIIGGEVLRKSAEVDTHIEDTELIAKNSPQHRKELAKMLRETSLPSWKAQLRTVPLVVVTGSKSPDSLVNAGAWRILTRLTEHDDWYSLSKLYQTPSFEPHEQIPIPKSVPDTKEAETHRDSVAQPSGSERKDYRYRSFAEIIIKLLKYLLGMK